VLKTWLAFAIIYFVWGSTFLTIRVGVMEVPPFLLAGLRFAVAGAAVFGWALLRGERPPTKREWAATLPLAFVIFGICYGFLFWAEQRVTSGVAAVLAATIPLFTAIAEAAILRTHRLTVSLVAFLLVGVAGVAVLVSPGLAAGEPVDGWGAAALIVGSASWSVATVATRRLPLPSSGTMRSGSQMLAGGVMLFGLAALLGEFGRFAPASVSTRAWLSLAYLIVAGSIVAYTAYVWLLAHVSPTKVGSYAYVNPVVAVLLGWLLLNEPLGLRVVLGTLLVLTSVGGILLLRAAAAPAAAQPARNG
jgi:drug/metabolite transporter (DMT)-like permease